MLRIDIKRFFFRVSVRLRLTRYSEFFQKACQISRFLSNPPSGHIGRRRQKPRRRISVKNTLMKYMVIF